MMSSGFPPAWTGNSSQLGLLLEKHVCNRSNYKKILIFFVILGHLPLTFSPLSQANCAKGDM